MKTQHLHYASLQSPSLKTIENRKRKAKRGPLVALCKGLFIGLGVLVVTILASMGAMALGQWANTQPILVERIISVGLTCAMVIVLALACLCDWGSAKATDEIKKDQKTDIDYLS